MTVVKALALAALVRVAGWGSPLSSPAGVVTLEFDCQQLEAGAAGAGNASLTADVTLPADHQR